MLFTSEQVCKKQNLTHPRSGIVSYPRPELNNLANQSDYQSKYNPHLAMVLGETAVYPNIPIQPLTKAQEAEI